jgi:competence protein ComEC
VASAGFNNRYQHPHPMTLARLADLKIPVISTIDQGAIQFKVESEQQDTTVQGYRQKWQWLQRQALN